MIDEWTGVFARIKSALRKRGRSDHDAEDLMQEAFVKLTLYGQKKIVREPQAFLMATAINLSRDAFRASARRGQDRLANHDVLEDAGPSLEEVMLSRERTEQLVECFERLPTKTKAIFLAHRAQGMSYRQIARRHRMSVSGVEKHIAKAVLLVTAWMEAW